jgi:hypothetical protein
MRAAVKSQRGGDVEPSSSRRGCAMILQKSWPAEHGCFSFTSTGPLKMWMHHPQHEKRTPTKYTKKLEAFRTLENCHGPYVAK